MKINCGNLILVFLVGCVLFGPWGGIVGVLLILLMAKEVKNISDNNQEN